MLNTWYNGLTELPEGFELDRDYWQQIMLVKTAVNKEIENQRNNKVVGGSLQAEVTLYAQGGLLTALNKLGDELRFVLITSKANILPFEQAPTDAVATELADLQLTVKKSDNQKCGRCWHYVADVGQHADHPELCGRCITNVYGAGEERHNV